MKSIDAFQFKTFSKDEPVDHNPIDYTPYDDKIPREFRIEESDTLPPDVQVGMDWAQDLITWALAEIGWPMEPWG